MAALLFAAAFDWIEALLPLLFVLFWIVSQIRNLFRALNPGKPAGPVGQRPVPPRQVDDEVQRELSRQIDEFLRRQSGERAAAPPARPRGGPEARPQQRGGQQRGGQQRGVQQPRRVGPPPAPPVAGRRPALTAGEARGAGPAAAPAARPTPQLGSLGGHSTDVARHVHDAFAREIEHLPPSLARPAAGAAAAASVVAPATDIAALLRNPATLRQLVLVREILERPVDRW